MTRTNWKYKSIFVLALSAVAATVCACTVLTLIFTRLTGNITVIWPVEGVVLALMLGYFKRTPLLVLVIGEAACVVGAMFMEKHALLPIAMGLVKIIGTWNIYLFLGRFTEEDRFFKSKNLLLYIAVCGVFSFLSGFIFSTIIHFMIGAPVSQFMFAGAANSELGYVVLTPLLVILSSPRSQTARQSQSLLRSTAIVGAFSASVFVIFLQTRYPLLFLIPIGFMGVAYTVEMKAVAMAVLVTVIIAVAMTASGFGPFQLTHGGLAERIQILQVFIGVMTMTTLPIAALMAEHARLKQSLIDARIEAEAANQAKSVFLATISHEIRTPLNGVLGMAQIMSMDQLSDKQRERVDVVRRSGEALLSLLNDVLDLSKIEAGKLTFETIEFDLGAVLGDVVCAFESLAREKGVALTLDMGDSTGVYLGDPLRLRQIVFNLISNALKFTAAGSVQIRADFNAEGLRIFVSDTGIGIPADKIGALFSKFNQVDESTTRRFGGTGLGLSISRELSELMGGGVQVASVEGQGSTFTITLPLERIAETGFSVADADDQAEFALQADLRILAAEDNATNRLILKTLLELSGVDVVIVENGEEAVKAWEDGEWDVVLMDVQMPIMDGPTATRIIRRREAETGRAHTPVIALTANTMAHQVKQYLDAGMDGHLAKPIELSALLDVLAAAAEFSQDRRALSDVA